MAKLLPLWIKANLYGITESGPIQSMYALEEFIEGLVEEAIEQGMQTHLVCLALQSAIERLESPKGKKRNKTLHAPPIEPFVTHVPSIVVENTHTAEEPADPEKQKKGNGNGAKTTNIIAFSPGR
jgi:hypothetical protein